MFKKLLEQLLQILSGFLCFGFIAIGLIGGVTAAADLGYRTFVHTPDLITTMSTVVGKWSLPFHYGPHGTPSPEKFGLEFMIEKHFISEYVSHNLYDHIVTNDTVKVVYVHKCELFDCGVQILSINKPDV